MQDKSYLERLFSCCPSFFRTLSKQGAKQFTPNEGIAFDQEKRTGLASLWEKPRDNTPAPVRLMEDLEDDGTLSMGGYSD